MSVYIYIYLYLYLYILSKYSGNYFGLPVFCQRYGACRLFLALVRNDHCQCPNSQSVWLKLQTRLHKGTWRIWQDTKTLVRIFLALASRIKIDVTIQCYTVLAYCHLRSLLKWTPWQGAQEALRSSREADWSDGIQTGFYLSCNWSERFRKYSDESTHAQLLDQNRHLVVVATMVGESFLDFAMQEVWKSGHQQGGRTWQLVTIGGWDFPSEDFGIL